MADKPTINDLRALASMLPPSERVFAGEVSDVLSAVVNVVAHGPDLIAAAKEGGVQGVYDFYHNAQVDKAKEAGVDEPVKGNPVHTEQVAPTATGGIATSQAPQIDYDKLAAALVKAQEAHTAQETPAPAPAEQSSTTTPDVTPPPVEPSPAPSSPSEGFI